LSGGLVIDSISVRIDTITNKDTLKSSRFKFRQPITLFENVALTPEDSKVVDAWLVTGKDLIGSLVQVFAEVEPVGGMACGSNGFGPKVVRRLKLRKHGSCRIHKSPVLPFGYTILLRGIGSGILMFDPLITQEFF
jgi:hypothetical protein